MCSAGVAVAMCACEILRWALVGGCGWHVHDARVHCDGSMGIGYGSVRKSVEGYCSYLQPPDCPILPCRYCDVPDVMCDAAAVLCDVPAGWGLGCVNCDG